MLMGGHFAKPVHRPATTETVAISVMTAIRQGMWWG